MANPLTHIRGRDPEFQATLFQQGDEQALAYFYKEFYPALALYANRWVKSRSMAEEIAAEALIKTWRMHEKLDTYAGIRAYLYKIVHRDSQLVAKREQRRAEIHSLAQAPQMTSDTPLQHTIRCEVYRIIHTALKDIAPGSRKILAMHYLEGKTTGQIATELNLSPSTVKTQKTRGLEALRKKLLRQMLVLFYLIVKFFLPIL